jgi:hypothetical protein
MTREVQVEKTRVEYLGLIISENRVEMDLVKVVGVADWPEPCNKWEVQSFLGFANFYCWFIKNFSHHTRPLFNLTKNEQKWQWGSIGSYKHQYEHQGLGVTTSILVA